MKSRLSAHFVALAQAVSALLVTNSQAAIVNWGPATTVSSDSDVSTTGSLVSAFNFSGAVIGILPSVDVNGVTFAPFAIDPSVATQTVANTTLTASTGLLGGTNLGGSGSPPFSLLSTSYQALLRDSAGSANAFTLAVSGLTIGGDYQFQWWANESSIIGSNLFTTGTAGSSVTLNWNNTSSSGGEGGVGQFAIGSFTADSPNQIVTFTSGTGSPIVAAFQLRQVSAVGVPDMGVTAAMLGVCLAGIVAIRRRLA